MKQKGWYKWTRAMDRMLTLNYEWVGDCRLAEMFEERFPKGYPWTCKHIEKRRSYLRLKRTKEQEKTLRFLNCLTTDKDKSWDTRGRSPEGSFRFWKGQKFIKVNGRFILYAPYQYQQETGNQIPAHHVIRDGRLIHRSEHAIRNTLNRNGKQYPEPIIEAVIALSKLKNITDGKEN
jgi:hypothetical protein